MIPNELRGPCSNMLFSKFQFLSNFEHMSTRKSSLPSSPHDGGKLTVLTPIVLKTERKLFPSLNGVPI